jgi:hypothetical protein
MLNTYINENLNVPYPFYGTDALPFPNSCITGIQIAVCIASNYAADMPSYYLYASSITFSKDAAYLVICRSDTNEPILALSAVKTGVSGTSTALQNRCTDSITHINGFLELGIIPEEAYGLYTGKFIIDPSCVSCIPDTVMNFGNAYVLERLGLDTDQCINVVFDGLFTCANKVSDGVHSCSINVLPLDDLDMYTITDERNYTRVNTVNGVATECEYSDEDTESGTELSIVVDDDSKDLIELSSASYDNGVVISIKGTSKFRNCYKQVGETTATELIDQADEGA